MNDQLFKMFQFNYLFPVDFYLIYDVRDVIFRNIDLIIISTENLKLY